MQKQNAPDRYEKRKEDVHLHEVNGNSPIIVEDNHDEQGNINHHPDHLLPSNPGCESHTGNDCL